MSKDLGSLHLLPYQNMSPNPLHNSNQYHTWRYFFSFFFNKFIKFLVSRNNNKDVQRWSTPTITNNNVKKKSGKKLFPKNVSMNVGKLNKIMKW